MTRRQRSGQAEAVTPQRAAGYLRMAHESLRAAQASFERGDYHASCNNSVHAGIQASDSVSGYLAGTRWAGREHAQAVQHVESAGADGRDIAKHLRKLLPKKNLYQYDPCDPSQKEAADILLAAQRAVTIAERVANRARGTS